MSHPEGTRLFPSIESEFFKNVQPGKVYRYSDDFYVFVDVKDTAEYYGVRIEYCEPGSLNYERFGPFSFLVLTNDNIKIPENKTSKYTFDPNNLVLI